MSSVLIETAGGAVVDEVIVCDPRDDPTNNV
jgi:hypothetical protein